MSRTGSSAGPRPDLERHFEGPDVLQGLLELSGSPRTVEEVAELYLAAQSQAGVPGDVIPALFPEEPRFPSPDIARALFGNLLGLWDLLASGKPLPAPPRVRAPKPEPVAPPAPFGPDGPTPAFIAAAFRYLDAHPRERERRVHAFENRQDALLAQLDEEGLEDVPDAVARQLLFGLHVLLELGWTGRVRRVRDVRLSEPVPAAALPSALLAYLEDALRAAQEVHEAPLSAAQAETVRRIGRAGLHAWWRAGREGA